MRTALESAEWFAYAQAAGQQGGTTVKWVGKCRLETLGNGEHEYAHFEMYSRAVQKLFGLISGDERRFDSWWWAREAMYRSCIIDLCT